MNSDSWNASVKVFRSTGSCEEATVATATVAYVLQRSVLQIDQKRAACVEERSEH